MTHLLGKTGSWWAATVAAYCPGRMAEHPESKSTGGFLGPEWSPCSCNPPATAPAAVVGREGRHHVVVSGVARHGGLPARGRRRRHGEGGAAAQAVLLLLLVWLAVLPQVLGVQVDSGQVQYFGVHQWSLKLKRQCNKICTDINPLGLAWTWVTTLI